MYFPYKKVSNVDKAVSTYAAIGMDDSYSEAIRAFASLEVIVLNESAAFLFSDESKLSTTEATLCLDSTNSVSHFEFLCNCFCAYNSGERSYSKCCSYASCENLVNLHD